MSLPVSISQLAEEDMACQFAWYAREADVEIANRYILAVDVVIGMLAQQPGMGVRRMFAHPELSGMRFLPLQRAFRKHLVFYRENPSGLSIERVMHGHRDLPRRLLERPGSG